jgi:alpha-beta hydrolase superfamily lysophospholipase
MLNSTKGDVSMRQQRRNQTRLGLVPNLEDGEVTVEQALAMRNDQARRAAQYADRVEQARTCGRWAAMRHWMHEYRRATEQCRLLGERIRSERTTPAQTAPGGAPQIADAPGFARLARRVTAEMPPAGEAA